jgi:hypothetical protein
MKSQANSCQICYAVQRKNFANQVQETIVLLPFFQIGLAAWVVSRQRVAFSRLRTPQEYRKSVLKKQRRFHFR